MRTLKLTLAYDGTAYAGWQVQPGCRTVQGTLEAAVRKVTGQSVRVVASGRTDAGVHALGQVAGFQTHSDLPADVLRRALNAELPEDVAVLEVAEAADGFHPIRDALRKRYRYLIHDAPVRDVFGRQYCWHYTHGRLDAEAISRAAGALLGTHDFRSFQSSGAERESSVRTIFDISVQRLRSGEGTTVTIWRGTVPFSLRENRDSPPLIHSPILREEQGRGEEHDWITLEVEADGFLYNMVRAIVGTLVEVGRGAQGESWPAEVLQAADRAAAGPTAPPQGLFLVRVDYDA